MWVSLVLPYTESLGNFSQIPRKSRVRLFPEICLFLAVVLCSVTPAMSAMVSGHVYDPGGHLMPTRTFTVYKANGSPTGRQFTTSSYGTYSIYLEQGDYIIRPADNPHQEATITSYAQPVNHDIHLHAT